MNFISLFTGIALHDLGLTRAGLTCVGQCEIDPFCNAVLEKNFPTVPRWKDVHDVSGLSILNRCRGPVGLLTGGFPCQDISAAGKGEGLDGARSGLFFEIVRVLREMRDAGAGVPWVLLENVPALRTRGYDRVHAELAGLGYAVWTQVVGAWACGAPHKRDRVWIVAHLGNPNRLRFDGLHEVAGGVGAGDDGQEESEPAWGAAEELAGAGAGDGAGRGERAGYVEHAERERLGPGRIAGMGATLGNGGDNSDDAAAAADAMLLADASRHGQRQQPAAERADGERAGAGGDIYLADPGQSRLAGRRELPVGAGSEVPLPASGGGPLWPARPGEPQHGWEAARLVEFPVGGAVDGLSPRLARFANRHALKALGNANPPYVPELIGRWIMAVEAVAPALAPHAGTGAGEVGDHA